MCPDSRNNHTETVLIKSLLGPLALAYWLLLHLDLTHFLYFIFYHQGMRPTGKVMAAPWFLPDSAFFLPAFSLVFPT